MHFHFAQGHAKHAARSGHEITARHLYISALLTLGCDLILATAAGMFRRASFRKPVPRPWLKVRFLDEVRQEGRLVIPQLLPLPPSPWTMGQVCVHVRAGDDSPVGGKVEDERCAVQALPGDSVPGWAHSGCCLPSGLSIGNHPGSPGLV